MSVKFILLLIILINLINDQAKRSTALILAVENSHLEIVKLLLENEKLNVREVDEVNYGILLF